MIKNEVVNINESLNKREILTPKLRTIDNNKPYINEEFPTRLVIPAKNFTATFLRVGYLGLKAIINNHQDKYPKYIITQSPEVKECWENFNQKI